MAKSVKSQNRSVARKTGINAGKFGSVYERNGMVFVDFRYLGKRIRESSGLPTNKENMKTVRGQLDRINEKILTNEFHFAEIFPQSINKDQITILERKKSGYKESPKEIGCKSYIPEWLETRYKTGKIAVNTYLKYQSNVHNYLLPFFGEATFADINLSSIEKFSVWAKSKKVGDRFVTNYMVNANLKLLKQVCNHASLYYSWGTEFNPFHGHSYLPENDSKDGIFPLKLSEQKNIISNIDEHFQQMVLFAFRTGVRFSELIGLKPSDMNYESRIIQIRRSIKRSFGNTFIEGPTKNRYSNRAIKIDDDVLWNAIAEQNEKQQSLNSEYFFCTKEGNLIHPSNYINRYWKPVFKKTGISYRSPKQTRHSFCTNCLSLGEQPDWVAKVMGHRNIDMIVNRYSRYVENISGVADGEKIKNAFSTLFT